MSIASYFSKSSASSRLGPKEQNRLNEAAKIRVVKVLGVKRNMIDLTDGKPPRKMARMDNSSRMGFRHTISSADAPAATNISAADHQETTRTQSISSPRISSLNQTSTHDRRQSVMGPVQAYQSSTDNRHMHSPPGHPRQPQSPALDAPPHPTQPLLQPAIPGTTIQSDARGLVSYQAPTQQHSPHASVQANNRDGPRVNPQNSPHINPYATSHVNSQQAPTQHNNTSVNIYAKTHDSPHINSGSPRFNPNNALRASIQVNPQVVQTAQSPNLPHSTDLAHPVDLLNNISLSVASLEQFQLQQILSTAALRHPDVLEDLRTMSRIQETNRSTAHQALFDLLRAQSQQELRIARLQEERSRRGSAYTASPYGPPPSNLPAAAPPHLTTTAAPTQAHGPSPGHVGYSPQVSSTRQR
jgi:hypothetical protein